MFPHRLASQLSTHYLSQQPEALAYLSNLSDCCCHLIIHNTLSLEINLHKDGQIHIQSPHQAQADITLTGSRQDFFEAARQLQAGQTLIGQNIQIQGNMQKLQQLQSLIQQFDLHWTGLLNAFIGPQATGMAQQVLSPILERAQDLYQDFN